MELLIEISTAFTHAAKIHAQTIWSWTSRTFGMILDESWRLWHVSWDQFGPTILGHFRGALGIMFWPIVISVVAFFFLTKLEEKHSLYGLLYNVMMVVLGIVIGITALPVASPFLFLLVGFIMLAMMNGLVKRTLMLLVIIGIGACLFGSYVSAYWLVAILALPLMWWHPGFFTTVIIGGVALYGMTNWSADWRLPLALVLAWTIYAWQWLPKAK